MREHTRRTPAEELSTEGNIDAARLKTRVVSYRGGPGPNAMRTSDDGKTMNLNLTDAYFKIALRVDDKEFGSEGDWGWPTLGAILRDMAISGFRVHCCLTCKHYEPSRMVDEWSLGAEGYCLAAGEPDMEHLTHMLHECELWTERGEDDNWFGIEFTRG